MRCPRRPRPRGYAPSPTKTARSNPSPRPYPNPSPSTNPNPNADCEVRYQELNEDLPNAHPNQVCCQKLNKYLTRFQLAPRFTTAELRHWMLTRSDVVYTYVVEDPDTKEITDMVSSCHT